MIKIMFVLSVKRAPKKNVQKKKSKVCKDSKRRATKRLPLDLSKDDGEVSDKPDDGDSIVMGTPPRLAKKKKLFPVGPNQADANLKDMLRNPSGGRKPWIEINAKKEYLLVHFFYPSNKSLVTKTRRVNYPKPGQPLILCDD